MFFFVILRDYFDISVSFGFIGGGLVSMSDDVLRIAVPKFFCYSFWSSRFFGIFWILEFVKIC